MKDSVVLFQIKQGTIHYLGAVLGIVLSLGGLLLNGIWLPLVIWVLGSGIMRYLKIQNFIWWVEMLAFITIIGGMWVL